LDVIITATSVADTSKAASAIVTVLAVTVLVSPGSALIPVNATTQLNATKFTAAVGNDPNNKGVSWALARHNRMFSGMRDGRACQHGERRGNYLYCAPDSTG
jgi:hypothetical protein